MPYFIYIYQSHTGQYSLEPTSPTSPPSPSPKDDGIGKVNKVLKIFRQCKKGNFMVPCVHIHFASI